MDATLFATAIAFSCGTLWLAAKKRAGPLRWVKALPALLLAVTLRDRPLLAGGFVLYAIGDAFLLEKQRFFLHGLIAFLLGHLAVVAGLVRDDAPEPRGLVVGTLVGAGMVVALWPGLKPVLRVAVPIYAASLVILAYAATGRGATAGLGALFFLLSDALLGWNRFRAPLPGGDLAVLGTYYLAILLLAAG